MSKPDKTIELKTERLLLTPYGMKYLESAYEYTSDIENTKYMMFLPNNTIEEAIEYLEKVDEEWKKDKPALYEFAIIYEGRHVGAIGIDVDEDRTVAELGWSLNKKYWRMGITSEAAFAVVDFAVNELGIRHFIAHCDSENIASYKLMEKIGMKLTDSYGGRKNKSSDEERTELLYEMYIMKENSFKEIVIDMDNYNANGTVFRRTAVRGIIKKDNKYLIIHSKYGDYKFPGGGQKKDEDNMATLIREVKEETGYTVILDSVKEAFVTYEKRKGDPDDLMEMTSYYYFCDVEEVQGDRNLDDYEAEYDYKVKWMELNDIIAENDKVTDYENIPWVVRENTVMKALKELFIPQV